MFLVALEMYAETASFRVSETHTFHKTLALPPYTTCVGLLGAALGLEMESAQSYVKENGISIGVAGQDRGEFRDLWKYRKVKSKETISDVLIREYRVDLTCLVVYGTQSKESADVIADGFQDPVYALTAGHSDSLIYLRNIEVLEADPIPLQNLENCVVPGDIAQLYKPDESILDLPITQKIRPASTAHLPVSFSFDGDKRTVQIREPFTFVGNQITLSEPIDGFLVNDYQVVLR